MERTAYQIKFVFAVSDFSKWDMTIDDRLERQQKIIVALFLLLGKALPKLTLAQNREMFVSESEIKNAWIKQQSPVRLISTTDSLVPRDGMWAMEKERVFRCVLGDLDLTKTGLNLKGNMPEEPKPTPERRRVFDLE